MGLTDAAAAGRYGEPELKEASEGALFRDALTPQAVSAADRAFAAEPPRAERARRVVTVLAGNMRRMREREGHSQESLGELCDMPRTAISTFERAGREPRLSTLLLISEALGVPLIDFLDGL